jgi:hypothetical protein
MKDNKLYRDFWIGFVVTALAVAGLYWLWRRRQAVAPRPLLLVPGLLSDAAAADRLAVDATMAAEAADDLQVINGIGPVYARRLYEAGITTYHQLVVQTPDQLRHYTRVQPWQADPADWIEQARALID